MKQIIEDLFPLNRCLMGEGYDNALKYINLLVPLDIKEFPSGMQVGTWTVPEEWVVRSATVTYKKNCKRCKPEVILDYQKDPLCLVVGSLPFKGKMNREEFLKHLHYSDEQPSNFLYEYKFYEKDWGFTMPKNRIYKKEEGQLTQMILPEGEYEVNIDTEYRPGTMKVGVHTILGKTDREILLIAHLDHPYQANDNLSGVACLIDIVKKIKPLYWDHTIKLIFCPETIGSIAYATTEHMENVDFVIALDVVGNKHPEGIQLQKSFKHSRLNDCAHLALQGMGEMFRQAPFRAEIGSDEYVFNDPLFQIPGILLTTHPYPEYHTSADTPEIIDYEVLEKIQRAIIKTIEYYEDDFIPQRKFIGPLHRSGYGIQTRGKSLNLMWDYFIYSMDGEKTFSRLCLDHGLNYEHTLEHVDKLIDDGKIICSAPPR